jgi:hypothetical protein
MSEIHPPMPSAGGIKMSTELIDPIFESKIKPLTKAGGMKEGLLGLLVGIAAATLSLLGAIFLLTGGISPEEMRKSVEDSSWLYGWFAAIFIPIAPYLPYMLIGIGALSIFVAIYSGYRLATTTASTTMDIACPKCGKVYQFSKTVKRSFSFVCSQCYALIRGGKLGHDTLYRCSYCDFEYYGPSEKTYPCPSCGYKEGAKEQECPHCKAKIPRDVRFCRSCLAWLAKQEMHEVSLTSQPVVYDVSCFSPKVCQSFIKNLVPRIREKAEMIDKTLSPIENLKKGIQIYGNGGFIWALEPAVKLINSGATAVQWLYSNGGTLETELLSGFEESLRKTAPQIARIHDADLLLKKQDREFGNIIAIANETVSAAISQTAPV